MNWSKFFSRGIAAPRDRESNPHRVREMPLPGGRSPEEEEALQAVHAQLEGLTKVQAIRVLRTALAQVQESW